MVNWWVMEPGLRAKLFDQLAPRLRDTPEPYTYMISLPRSRIVYHKDKRIEKSKKMSMNVLEINGEPPHLLLLVRRKSIPLPADTGGRARTTLRGIPPTRGLGSFKFCSVKVHKRRPLVSLPQHGDVWKLCLRVRAYFRGGRTSRRRASPA